MPGPCTDVGEQRFDWPDGWNGRVSWTRRSPCRSARSWQKSRRLTLITCLVPPRAETLDGTSPVQQTRKSQQRSASYARKKRNLLNFEVRLLTGEAINVLGGDSLGREARCR